ncbi:MAG: class I SAM-dependent methyltransferase [Steroidobacteraceae bacterium]
MNELVFSPDALVRFRSGKIVIHTTSSALPAFETDHPMLVGWLCGFRKPMALASALGAVPPADRSAAERVVDYLRRAGVLIDAGEPAEPFSANELVSRGKQHLRLLARAVYDAACDLYGLGDHAESQLAARSGIGVERRLVGLLAAIDGLRQELASLRAEHIGSQLRSLGVDAAAGALRLHIGCGRGHIPGWINIDVAPAPLSMNVLGGLPFRDGGARYAFVSHFLEHLFFPADVRPFLADVHRVLEPGGVLRIVVPDVEQCIEAYMTNDRSFFASRRESWPWWPANPTRLEDFLGYAGTSPEPAHLFESHKYGYDFETLARVLGDAGFVEISRSTFMASAHDALRVDDASAVARAKYGEKYYSLFVEARKSGA